MMWEYGYTDEMYHHGILGMKWGIRRYQNKDGTLTEEGRRRLGYYKEKSQSKLDNRTATLLSFTNNEKTRAVINKMYDTRSEKISNMTYKQMMTEKAAKTAIKVGVIASGNIFGLAAVIAVNKLEKSGKIEQGAEAVSDLLLSQTADEKNKTSTRNRQSRKNAEKEELIRRRSGK